MDGVDGDVLEFAAVLHGASPESGSEVRKGCGAKPCLALRSMAREGLSGLLLLALERLGEALRLQVAVPHSGEADVAPV